MTNLAPRGIVPDRELFVEKTVARGMEFWARLVKDWPDRALVYDDGIVKGFCLHHPCRDADAADAHEVGPLYVEPAFVRQGVGGRLMAAAEAAGVGAGRSSVKLWALEANHGGCRFYESLGYRFDGTTKVIAEWNGAVERRYAKTLAR